MAGTLAAQGKRVADQMTALYEEYGYFVTNNGYLFITDAGTVPGIFERLINGGKYQDALRQWKVASIRDLHGAGVDTSQPDGKPTLPTSASTHMLTYTFENGAVITLRTSGTEPKLKYYAEMAAGTPQAATACVFCRLRGVRNCAETPPCPPRSASTESCRTWWMQSLRTCCSLKPTSCASLGSEGRAGGLGVPLRGPLRSQQFTARGTFFPRQTHCGI